MKRIRRILFLLLVAGALTGGCIWLWRARRVQAKTDLASAVARQGDFQVIVRTRGEVVAERSLQLVAPQNVPNMMIAWQAPNNGPVKKDDVVVRFDSSSARQQIREKEAAQQAADATLAQAVSQTRITAEQDRMDLTAAQVEVEKQKLEVSKQEIVSRLQGEESKIDLGLAEERLRVVEATVQFHEKVAASQIASLTRQRDKSKQDVEVTTERMSRMEIRAPSNGIIVYSMNYSQGWVNAKAFKVGDAVWPGSMIAELPDMSSLELKGKLEEVDRGKVIAGQEAHIKVDPLPEKIFDGKLESISPLVEQNFEWPPSRNFRAYARFADLDPRLRPGMNGQTDIVVQHIPNAISVPANALFTHRDRPTVYVSEPSGWRPQEVEIVARNPDEVAIRGIAAGTRVALVEPDIKEIKTP